MQTDKVTNSFKGIKKFKRYTNSALVLFLMITMSVVLSACGKKDNSKEEQPVDNTSTTEQTTEVQSETEPETSNEEAEETPNVEETEADVMEVWLASVNLRDPNVLIWDEETSTGTIVEEGGNYEIDANNKFFLYIPLGMSFDSIRVDTLYEIKVGEVFSDTCLELIVPLEDENPSEIGVITPDGTVYTQKFTLFMAR